MSSPTPKLAGQPDSQKPSHFAPITRVLKWFFSQGGHLKDRVIRGGIWLVLGDVFSRGAGLAKLAVLGRLLAPRDFGLMGIAMVILNAIQYFTETGFNASLIQKSEDIHPDLNTAWTVQILRSTGVALVLFLIAPLGAQFFGNPGATWIIRAVGLITFLKGFTNPAVIYLRKDLDLRREVIWKSYGVLVGLIVAVVVAILYRNVWALVLSVISAQAVETALSFQVIRYRPRIEFHWERARQLYRFGRWVFWLNVLGYFGLYTDSLVTAKLLGATALGFYQMASQLAMLPTTKIAMHLRGVMFPAFSQLQKSPDLKRIFLKTLSALAWVTIPVGCFLCVFAKPLVLILLGARWVSISPALQWLAWAGVGTAVPSIVNPLLMGIGKPNLAVRTSVLKVTLLGLSIYPLSRALGITGVAISLTLATLLSGLYHFSLVLGVLRPKARELAGALKGGVLGSIPFGVAGLVQLTPYRWLLIPAVLAAGAVYSAMLFPAMKSHLKGQPKGTVPPPQVMGEAEVGFGEGI